jgi:hypothetical protein
LPYPVARYNFQVFGPGLVPTAGFVFSMDTAVTFDQPVPPQVVPTQVGNWDVFVPAVAAGRYWIVCQIADLATNHAVGITYIDVQ